MKRVVIDTNVLVSALWTRQGNASRILDMIVTHALQPCYNSEIMTEYKNVLSRPNFKFSETDISNLLDIIKSEGISILAAASNIRFIDESDRVFYDVAKACNAYLITGNKKHFPNDQFILSPAEFLAH